MQGISLMLCIHKCTYANCAVPAIVACIVAKYDASMRLINEVHKMQTGYKTDYDMQKINTQTMTLHTVLVITRNCTNKVF